MNHFLSHTNTQIHSVSLKVPSFRFIRVEPVEMRYFQLAVWITDWRSSKLEMNQQTHKTWKVIHISCSIWSQSHARIKNTHLSHLQWELKYITFHGIAIIIQITILLINWNPKLGFSTAQSCSTLNKYYEFSTDVPMCHGWFGFTIIIFWMIKSLSLYELE